jgi:hypothetical protein
MWREYIISKNWTLWYSAHLHKWTKPSVGENRRIQNTGIKNTRGNTRWFKYDRDYLCVNKLQFVPGIFEPPCTSQTQTSTENLIELRVNYTALRSNQSTRKHESRNWRGSGWRRERILCSVKWRKVIKEMKDKKATWRCTQSAGTRWSQNNDTTDHQHTRNWRVAQGFNLSYSVCTEEESESYKKQRSSHKQPHRT